MESIPLTLAGQKVIEECSELIQAICKAEFFGWSNYHPDRQRSSNMIEVKAEMEDVNQAMAKLETEIAFWQKDISERRKKCTQQSKT